MNDKKYIDVAKELIEKSNIQAYTVISNSMWPLINKNDKIICSKAEYKNIRKYSLIAFYANFDNSQVPTVHRVIKIIQKNNELIFQTKGDNSLVLDKGIIYPKQIIGIVDEIIKEKFIIYLNKNIYKIISISIYFLSNIKNFIKSFLLQIKKSFVILFLKEESCKYDDNLIVLRQSLLTKTKDWQKIVNINVSLLENLLDKDMKICDISFGGGYCEESFTFIRQGFEIDYKKTEVVDDKINQYDFIICSRVINIVQTKEKRQEIYNLLKSYIKQDGKILLSYINEKNNWAIRLKRNIYKLFLKRYNGPIPDDIIYGNIFVMKHLFNKLFIQELQDNGFYILQQKNSDKITTFLIAKN